MYMPITRSKLFQFDRFLWPLAIIAIGILVVGGYGNQFGRTAVSSFSSLSFIPNTGLGDPAVQYTLRQPGATTYFTAEGLRFSWVAGSGDSTAVKTVGLQFLGVEAAAVQGENLLPGVVNYLHGSDPAAWRTGVPTYGTVIYENLYPGVDLAYSGSGQQLVATFRLESGDDLDRIAWLFEGATADMDAATGALSLVIEGRPSGMQLLAPQARLVAGGEWAPAVLRYTIDSDGRIGLKVAGEISAEPVFVMLPVLLPGELGNDYGDGIAVDGSGNVYVVGDTTSDDFPTVNPAQSYGGNRDIFVSKFSADGSSLIYSTFIGGSDFEAAEAIAIDGNGAAYLTGFTQSTDFPTITPYQPTLNGNTDIFISVLAADGSALLYSTYFGGSAGENGLDIYPKNDDIFLTGTTLSGDFPTQNSPLALHGGGYDAFVLRLTPGSNTLVFSLLLGGDFSEFGNSLAVDSSNNVVVVGRTDSDNFPTANPIQANNMGLGDMFLTAVAADGGSLLYSTYLGGSWGEDAQGVAIDGAGNVHIAGQSESPDFPLVDPFPAANPPGQDAAVVTVSADGSTLLFSTLLGASNDESASDIALDGSGGKYLVGYTSSPDFPLQQPIQANLSGFMDIFVTKLDTDNEIVFSTFLGGEVIEEGRGIVVDGAQNIYLAGDTMSFEFPTANAFQPGYAGGARDVVVTKINGANYGLDYSTYLGGGPYPGNPTAVSLTEFDGRSTQFNSALYLAAALLLIFLFGGLFLYNKKKNF